MNVALYNPQRGHELLGTRTFPGCTRDELVEMTMGIQIEALEEGISLGSMLLVAWQDFPSQYLSVFPLGDDTLLDEEMLNGIEALARTRH